MIDSDRSTFVEQALASLHDAAIPDGPPAQILDATAERLRSLAIASDARSRVPNRARLLHVARYGSVAVACASVIAAALWNGFFGRSATIAFADVREQVQKLRSVQYMETTVERTEQKDQTQPNETERKTGGVKSEVRKRSRHFILGRFLTRTEVLDSDGQVNYARIFDAKTGKRVNVFPKTKRFEIISPFTFDSKTGKKMDGGTPLSNADFYASFRQVPAEATTRLPAKMLGDKQVVGFVRKKLDEKHGPETWKAIYWVDPNTKLPVQIEVTFRINREKEVLISNSVLSDFAFDKELSASFFNTQPPEGYSIRKLKVWKP